MLTLSFCPSPVFSIAIDFARGFIGRRCAAVAGVVDSVRIVVTHQIE